MGLDIQRVCKLRYFQKILLEKPVGSKRYRYAESRQRFDFLRSNFRAEISDLLEVRTFLVGYICENLDNLKGLIS